MVLIYMDKILSRVDVFVSINAIFQQKLENEYKYVCISKCNGINNIILFIKL